MLSDRRKKILNALIEEYISTATPVSSRAIVGNHELGVSSATVRNELYVLEEDGYVRSPHVSSGRIPTDSGYRSFVDDLLAGSVVVEGEEKSGSPEKSVGDELRDSADELDELLKKTSKALNRFTDCLAVVMSPKITTLALKQIALVRMDSRHLIAVAAIKDGRSCSKIVEMSHDVSTEEVRTLERLLCEEYGLRGEFDPRETHKDESHAAVVAKTSDPLVVKDLEQLVAAVDECLIEEEREKVHHSGIEDLFSQPEMQKMSLTMGVAKLLDDDLTMFRLLGDFLATKGVSVRIGRENADATFEDISVVASSYGGSDGTGIVAIVGPTRMNYEKVIDAVRNASGFLDETMRAK